MDLVSFEPDLEHRETAADLAREAAVAIKNVVVYMNNDPRCQARLDGAIELATAQEARVTGVFALGYPVIPGFFEDFHGPRHLPTYQIVGREVRPIRDVASTLIDHIQSAIECLHFVIKRFLDAHLPSGCGRLHFCSY